jgi:hypothetical protein
MGGGVRFEEFGIERSEVAADASPAFPWSDLPRACRLSNGRGRVGFVSGTDELQSIRPEQEGEQKVFFTLPGVTLLIARGVPFAVVGGFDKPSAALLSPVAVEDLSSAWHQSVKFAACVAGISGGVRIREIERYISAPEEGVEVLVLNAERRRCAGRSWQRCRALPGSSSLVSSWLFWRSF